MKLKEVITLYIELGYTISIKPYYDTIRVIIDNADDVECLNQVISCKESLKQSLIDFLKFIDQ